MVSGEAGDADAGELDPGESCDTAIPNGAGACPVDCRDGDTCTTDVLSGTLGRDLARLAHGDRSTAVRDEAWLALASQGDPDAQKRIHDQWTYRTFAVHARLDPAASRSRLRDIVEAEQPPSGLSQDFLTMERVSAAWALDKVGDPLGRQLLYRMLADCGSPGGVLALGALESLGSVTSADANAVVSCLREQNPLTRLLAAIVCLKRR